MKKCILIALLIASVLSSSVSCQNAAPTHNDQPDNSTTATEALPAGIESKDYGLTFNILYPDWGLYANYFFAEENTGDAMDMAIFNRELKVEEYLGVDITSTLVPIITDIRPTLQKAAMSGEDSYQFVLSHCITDTQATISEELLLDVNKIPTLDLSNDHWNQDSNKNLEVDGKQYFFTGDYNLPSPSLLLFNKSLVEQYNLENPYDIVRAGEWTVDKMMELMSAVTTDNGDTIWDVNDIYGLGAPNDSFLTSFLYSMGLKLADKNYEGKFVFAMNDNRTYNVVEKLEALLKSPNTFVYNYSSDYAGDRTQSLNIATGRSLFNLIASDNLHVHRDTAVDFGILPYPKFDLTQDRYYALDWSGLLCVPAAVTEKNMIGEVVELLGYYSAEEVIPTFYDIVLGSKLSRDENSREMLGIIFDSIVFDAGLCYFGFENYTGQFRSLADQILSSSWSGYASFLASYEAGASAEFAKLNDIVSSLE